MTEKEEHLRFVREAIDSLPAERIECVHEMAEHFRRIVKQNPEDGEFAIALVLAVRAKMIHYALADFKRLCEIADCALGFNVDFDVNMVQREWHLIDGAPLEILQEIPKKCAMHGSTDICQIPGPYGFKWPKLTEAYRHFHGKDFEDAHDAFADLRATVAVHLAIEKHYSGNA